MRFRLWSELILVDHFKSKEKSKETRLLLISTSLMNKHDKEDTSNTLLLHYSYNLIDQIFVI